VKNAFAALASGVLALGLAPATFAQTETAIDHAGRINACGAAPLVSARYLASGQLEVTCRASALSGTGLGAGAGVSILAGVIVLAVLAGGGDDTVSTTTTTIP